MLRRVVAYGLVILVMLLLLAGIVWLLVTMEPAGYTRPSDLTKVEMETQAAQFISSSSKLANALADKSNTTPVDVTFTDAMVNSQIRILPREQLAKLPSWLRNPQAVFTKDEIVLMADTHLQGAQSIISIHLAPSVTADGQLKLQLTGLRAGRLPMPDKVRNALTDVATQRIGELQSRTNAQPRTSSEKSEEDWNKVSLSALQAAKELITTGETVIPTRKHHLYLDGLELLPHQFRLVGKRIDKQPAPTNN